MFVERDNRRWKSSAVWSRTTHWPIFGRNRIDL